MSIIDVSPKRPADREYLGDGLFVSFDGFQFSLAASDGLHDTATVYLEPSVLNNFFVYAQRVGWRAT